MNNRSLEKRYRGLHYEIGQLPDRLIFSASYWSLPYEIRRFLYFVLSPRSHRRIYKLRSMQPENLNAQTLKPFYDTQSIFVHVPKAAGISVGFSLYGRKTGDHRTIGDYKLCFQKKEFNSFFKFTFVRNPWDRLVSAYLYMKKGGRNKDDYDWSMKFLSPYKNFEEFVMDWVNEQNIRLGLHFRPQYEFLCTNESTLELEFIGYFENIVHDYEHIRNKIGVGRDLAVYNKTANEKKDYRHYYSKRTREIVEYVYREDIRLLGYNFDNSSLKGQLAKRCT
jgi:hypothetical protein